MPERDLQTLNNELSALVEIFPNVQPVVFRDMLTNMGPKSRLKVVTEQILKAEAKWVKGRYRENEYQEEAIAVKVRSRRRPWDRQNLEYSQKLSDLPIAETVRSVTYKASVRGALEEEFRGLTHSTIKAVLAENNYAYTPSRAALLDIASRSWRASFSNFIFRRKPPSAVNHPLVTWTVPLDGTTREPKLNYTASSQLNDEIFETLVAPFRREQQETQDAADHTIAAQLQAEEAVEAEEVYDCECCYSSVPIHELTKCDENCHTVCLSCIRRTVNEAVYGQGWARSISVDRGDMPCIASTSVECRGYISTDAMRAALQHSEADIATYIKLQERLAEDALQKSKLPLIKCPFCYYAEVDDIDVNEEFKWRPRKTPELTMILGWVILALLVTGLLPFVLLIIALLLLTSTNPTRFPMIKPSLYRIARRRRGLRFTCQSPACGISSCMRCRICWRDPHSCHSAAVDSLAKRLESAMTAAVKRVCPRCNTAFVKAWGCNKLVCVCGYTMCYLCRAEIGAREGYAHFCQHFRPSGGTCGECEKCDLYRAEDAAVVIRQARERAEKDWWAGEGRGVDRAVVERQPLPGIDHDWKNWQTWELRLDAVIERYLT